MSVRFHSPIRTTISSILIIILIISMAVVSHAAQITLAWDPNTPSPDGYRIYQRIEGQSYDYSTPVWPKSGDDPTLTNCIINDLADDTSYHFVVRAYVGSEESGDSNEVNFVTPSAPPAAQFTISVNAGANGSISPGTMAITEGGSQTFAISPHPGYQIEDVLVDGQSVGPVTSYSFSQVTADRSISAVFSSIIHQVAASSEGVGTISPGGIVNVSHGTGMSYSITPGTAYTVANVQVDGQSIGAVSQYTFASVTASHTIHAIFEPKQHVLTSTFGPNGSMSPAGNVSVQEGSDLAFSVTPNSGYRVADVLVDGQSIGPVDLYTFSSVTASHTIHAVFEQNTHVLVSTAGPNGSIQPSGNVSVAEGGNLSFSVAPDTGYQVADVLVDGQSVGAVNSYTFTGVTAPHTIHVIFDSQEHIISSNCGPNGSISPSGNVSVQDGSDLTLTITPIDGCRIADVLVDGQSIGSVSNYTFTNVTTSHTIQAVFDVQEYTIVSGSGSNGSISPSGNVTVQEGDNLTFSIAPDSGYQIADVLVDGQSAGTMTAYTFTNITAAHSITAIFESIENTEEPMEIVIEAEDGDIWAPMEIGSSTTAPDDGYVWVPPGNGVYKYESTDAGRIDIEFDIATAGAYVIWGRVIAPDSGSDSFLVSVDGSDYLTWHTNRGDQASWTWDVVSERHWADERDASNPQIYYLDPGVHTITIQQREDGTKLDKLVITSRLDLTQNDLEAMFSVNVDANQTIAIEAESGDLSAPMEIGISEIASDDGYVWVPPGNGMYRYESSDAGRIDIEFNIATAGAYVIWGRVIAPDSGSDSFLVSVDGSDYLTWHTNRGDQASWTWDVVSERHWADERDASNPQIYYLDPGVHTITIQQREDGAKLDKLVITNTLGMTPDQLE